MLNLLITILFVLGAVNAYNLMDNLDGAASTVGFVSAAGIGVIAVVQGDAALGALMLALSGACAGFLPFNLARPSRIFLGDGGSMPLGFLIAIGIMGLEQAALSGMTLVLVATVLVGLPAFDTLLVVVSRLRRGVAIYLGG